MPIIAGLDTAMLQPAHSVPAVRRLGGGTIRLDDAGRPLRATGRNAVVYELRTPTGRILALRCLLEHDPQREDVLAARYAALRDDPRLERLRATGGPLPRDIRWVADGVDLPGPDSRGTSIPLLAMERVPGRTMARVVDRLCHADEAEPLALLADRWLETAALLEGARFSHGDLAADNLMVRPDGTIALVDLDTALWPSAPLAPVSGPDAETYTHPDGAPHDPAHRDRFPALIIWASLRILARFPALRRSWGDPPDQHGAALLWSRDDLRRPDQSSLFAALDALDDPVARPLLEIVRRAIRFAPDETPPLTEIADRLESLGLPRHASTSARDSGARDAAPGQPRAVPSPWGWPPKHQPGGHPPPPSAPARRPEVEQPAALAERDQHVAAAQRLGAAVKSRDVVTVMRLWGESRAIPEAATYAAAVHELVATEVTAAIDRAMRRRDDAGLIAVITEAERAGVAPSAEARAARRAARERIATREALTDTITRNDYRAIAALKLLGKLDGLGHLDPSHSRAVARAMAWPALERALGADDDAAIAAAADPALWRDEGTLSETHWQRLDLARARLRWLENVRAAIRQRDSVALRGLLAGAPPGAEQRLTEVEGRRILRATMREAAVARLERALREGPDREVVAALAEFEAAGAPFSDVLDWTAVRGVVDRISLVDAIRAATAADPPDTAKLARLLPAARAALGDGRAAGGPDWAALERAVLQAAHLARLREAIAADSDGRIAAAAVPDPYGANAQLTPEERERVQRALERWRGGSG